MATWTIAAEPATVAIDPAATALMIIDMQKDFLYPDGYGAFLGNDVTLLQRTIAPIQALLAAMRARGMLVIAMTTIGLRLIAYSLTTQPWVVLIIQLVHGLTFAAIFTAGVHYADQIAPPGMKSTTQGMFSGTLMGFGSAAGGLLGGVLMDHFSPGGMYGFSGGLVLVGLIVFLIVERRLVAKTGEKEIKTTLS